MEVERVPSFFAAESGMRWSDSRVHAQMSS
jgi:hypothetical protein